MNFWDSLVYGSQGKPAPPEHAPIAHSLKPLFTQWDTDASGTLEVDELRRGFLAAGLRSGDLDSAFAPFDGNAHISFEEFEAGLSDATRSSLEKQLTDAGVLKSLYVPPELWKDDRTAAELLWEQRVQHQAQRYGNQLRQNEILNDQLGGM